MRHKYKEITIGDFLNACCILFFIRDICNWVPDRMKQSPSSIFNFRLLFRISFIIGTSKNSMFLPVTDKASLTLSLVVLFSKILSYKIVIPSTFSAILSTDRAL